jgi:hypothetical protein
MVLFGDSHAAHWFPALKRLATEHGWRLVTQSKSNCPAADLAVWHPALKRPYSECPAWRADTLRHIARLAPDLVVVGSSFNYRPADGTAGGPRWWQPGWDRTFAALRATGADVAAIADTPYMDHRVPTCLAERPKRVHRCATARSRAVRGAAVREVFGRRAAAHGVHAIDPTGWMCGEICSPILGNVLVYRDSNHLTKEFADILAPVVEEHLPVLRSEK